jgi:hypothetical protein
VRGWLRRIVQGIPPGRQRIRILGQKTFLLVFVTNALADGIVPEQRGVGFKKGKQADRAPTVAMSVRRPMSGLSAQERADAGRRISSVRLRQPHAAPAPLLRYCLPQRARASDVIRSYMRKQPDRSR